MKAYVPDQWGKQLSDKKAPGKGSNMGFRSIQQIQVEKYFILGGAGGWGLEERAEI